METTKDLKLRIGAEAAPGLTHPFDDLKKATDAAIESQKKWNQAVRDAQRELERKSAAEAAKVLKECLSAPKHSERIKGARAVISYAGHDVSERVRRLEQEVEVLKRGTSPVKIDLSQHVTVTPEAFSASLNDARTALAPKTIEGEVIEPAAEPLPVGLKEFPGPSTPSVNAPGTLRFPTTGGTADKE
jgi:hypothetical protein